MSENWAEEAGFVGRRSTCGGAQNGGLGLGWGLQTGPTRAGSFLQHPAAAARQSRGAAANDDEDDDDDDGGDDDGDDRW